MMYGKNAKPTMSVESYPQKVSDKITHGHDAFIHKVWIQDLDPGQIYHYRIAGTTLPSPIHQFRTVPLETDRVTFVVYGDSRGHPEHHRRLVEQMIKIKPDFVIHTGDLVTSGRPHRLWGTEFFKPLKGLTEMVPIYITKGNHEGNNGNFERLLVPPGEGNNFEFE